MAKLFKDILNEAKRKQVTSISLDALKPDPNPKHTNQVPRIVKAELSDIRKKLKTWKYDHKDLRGDDARKARDEFMQLKQRQDEIEAMFEKRPKYVKSRGPKYD